MKFTKNTFIILSIAVCVLISNVLTKMHKNKVSHKKAKQVNLVIDNNGFDAELQHVVRRSPTVSSVTRFGYNRLSAPSNTVYMSNSNTSNGPNVGSLGNTAEIVGPHIVMHSKTPISVVKETPAHIGWRNEQKTITSLNLETGKAEHHTLNQKTPLYGNVEEVKTVYRNNVRSYDLEHKRFGRIISNISDQ